MSFTHLLLDDLKLMRAWFTPGGKTPLEPMPDRVKILDAAIAKIEEGEQLRVQVAQYHEKLGDAIAEQLRLFLRANPDMSATQALECLSHMSLEWRKPVNEVDP